MTIDFYQHPTLTMKELERALSEDRLMDFVRVFWPFVEPARDLVPGWPLEAICEHLEAVTSGDIKRLLLTVPPGFMKSLLTNVFYPAWEWGPRNLAPMRYMSASYSQSLTIRDNVRFRQVILSDLYRANWGDRFAPSRDQFNLVKVGNDKTGWKLATSVGGVGTGERADRLVLDDPNSVKEAESDAIRASTNQWFLEVVPTRLNDARKSAIIVIQQRTHEDDVAGIILSRELNYEHLSIPMEYDSFRHCSTSIGWSDPRGLDENNEPLVGVALDEVDGMLAWPERFPRPEVDELKATLGPYAAAAQLQQIPSPRGGGIFRREWWQDWPPKEHPDFDHYRNEFPPFDYVVASLDTAYGQKKTNDYSALTVWGIFREMGVKRLPPRLMMDDSGAMRIQDSNQPKLILISAWQKRLTIHGPPDQIPAGITEEEWNSKSMRPLRTEQWGLVEWVVDTCRRWKVDDLLVEAPAVGISAAQEIRRLCGDAEFAVHLISPDRDKLARAYSVVHFFSNGVIYCPHDRLYAELLMKDMSSFPKAKHDDLTDSAVQALKFLSERGLLLRKNEAEADWEDEMRMKRQSKPLYPV